MYYNSSIKLQSLCSLVSYQNTVHYHYNLKELREISCIHESLQVLSDVLMMNRNKYQTMFLVVPYLHKYLMVQ